MPTRRHNQNTLVLGQWNVLCDVCGFKFKSGDVQKRWDGLYVCKDDYEVRHPSDFFKGTKDDQRVPFNRPDTCSDTAYTDVGGNSVTPNCDIDTYGDESATITWGTQSSVLIWNTTLTADRTFTFAGSPNEGDRWIIYRNATTPGAFTLADSGGLQIIPASINAVVTYNYNGSAWTLFDYTTLGL